MAELTSQNTRIEIYEKDKNYSAFLLALRRTVTSQKYICSGNIAQGHYQPRDELIENISTVFVIFCS